MNNLKDELKNYYQSKSVSDEQFASLQARPSLAKRLFPVLGALTACLVLILMVQGESFEHKVMHEIVDNHLKGEASTITTSHLDQIQLHLADLDFKLVSSQMLPAKNWEIVGAKYCSIQGSIAAQIKIKNKTTGKLFTLYQVKRPDALTRMCFLDLRESKRYFLSNANFSRNAFSAGTENPASCAY
jgi:hypothetical protein